MSLQATVFLNKRWVTICHNAIRLQIGDEIRVAADMFIIEKDLWHREALALVDHFLKQILVTIHRNLLVLESLALQQRFGGSTVAAVGFRIDGDSHDRLLAVI